MERKTANRWLSKGSGWVQKNARMYHAVEARNWRVAKTFHKQGGPPVPPSPFYQTRYTRLTGLPAKGSVRVMAAYKMTYGREVKWATYTGHYDARWVRNNPDKLLARIDKEMGRQHVDADSLELINIWYEAV